MLELGVRASRRRDGCWPVGWEGCVGRENVTLFMMIFGSKMLAMVAMMTMVGMAVFRQKTKHESWLDGFSIN